MDALLRGVPAYVWVGLVYGAAILGGGYAVPLGMPPRFPTIDAFLAAELFKAPLFNGALSVTWMTLFIVMGFIAVGIETMRATRPVDDRSGNDWMSLAATLLATVLFAAAPPFQTTAFLIVVMAGVCDLLLDRYVGQKTARREIGLGGGR